MTKSTALPFEAINIPVVYVDFETLRIYAGLGSLGLILAFQTVLRNWWHIIKAEWMQSLQSSSEAPARARSCSNMRQDGASRHFRFTPQLEQTRVVVMASGNSGWQDVQASSGWTPSPSSK
jgi:hypothetical protein